VPPEALNRRAMEHLIKAGAFDTLAGSRSTLFANLDLILGYAATLHRERESNQVSLFGGAAESVRKPALAEKDDWPALEKLEHEFSAIGFYLSSHPLSGYKQGLEQLRVTSSPSLPEKLTGQYKGVKVAGIVTGRKFKASDKGRFAFLQMSDMGGLFEVSIFDELLLNGKRDLLENGKILLINADGKQDDSGIRLIAQTISLLDDALMKQQQLKGNASYYITFTQREVVQAISQLLGEPNGHGAQVILRAELECGMAHIELPGKYPLSPAIIDKIRSLKGVVAAEEYRS
jgi:DNA polymerase-3 subunit alpha